MILFLAVAVKVYYLQYQQASDPARRKALPRRDLKHKGAIS